MKIPIAKIPLPTSDLSTKTMCKTCAYKVPTSKDEDQYTIDGWSSIGIPHPCHERQNGMVCKGALDQFKRLGIKLDKELIGGE